MTVFRGQTRVVLPVSVPSDENTDDASGDNVGCVMSVVHGSGDTDQRRGGDGNQQNPRLDSVPALVEDVHLSGEEQGEVDHAAPAKGRVTGRESTETVVQEVCPRANPPRGESVDRVLGVVERGFTPTKEIGSRSTDGNL